MLRFLDFSYVATGLDLFDYESFDGSHPEDGQSVKGCP